MTKTSTAKKLAAASCVFALTLLSACSRTGTTDCSKTDDATLAANVKAELSKKMPTVAKGIKVASKDRVVTLTGTVDYEPNKKYAGDTAKAVECVKDVVNNIEVVRFNKAGCPQGQIPCCCVGQDCFCTDARIGCNCAPK